jgi:hypothetical protein
MLFDSLFDPPGKGAAAERGYALCAPLIEALDKYRADYSAYADSLSALVPKYLTTIPEDELRSGRLTYVKRDADYELSFSYGGPGRNICAYTPMTKKWSCIGYY